MSNRRRDAKNLDDYKEGTFTPGAVVFTPTALAVTYSATPGRYRKIGKVVHLRVTTP